MTDVLDHDLDHAHDDVPEDGSGTAPRRHRLRWTLVGLLVVLLVAAAVVAFTPLVAVRTVDVQGEVDVPRERLLDAAGIHVGDPVARIDLRAVGGAGQEGSQGEGEAGDVEVEAVGGWRRGRLLRLWSSSSSSRPAGGG